MLDEIIEQADDLSSRCLSQPWETTEKTLKRYLLQWHDSLQKYASIAETVDPKQTQLTLKSLARSIEELTIVFRSRNTVLLSQILADKWIPLMRNLRSNTTQNL